MYVAKGQLSPQGHHVDTVPTGNEGWMRGLPAAKEEGGDRGLYQ